MNGVPVLRTARLVLRPLRNGDAEALLPTLSDAATMLYWSRAPVADLEDAQAYLDGGSRAGWRAWFFAPAEHAPAIGWVSAGERKQPGVAEIGYMLAPERHGAGLAAEAVAAVLSHLFDTERYRRVFADTDPDNVASGALLRRLGFTLEGRLRGEWETHIGVRDSLIWGLLRDEWSGPRG